MTQLFTDDGHAVPVTVILAGPVRVVQKKTPETDGYGAVQLGIGDKLKNGISLCAVTLPKHKWFRQKH